MIGLDDITKTVNNKTMNNTQSMLNDKNLMSFKSNIYKTVNNQ